MTYTLGGVQASNIGYSALALHKLEGVKSLVGDVKMEFKDFLTESKPEFPAQQFDINLDNQSQ